MRLVIGSWDRQRLDGGPHAAIRSVNQTDGRSEADISWLKLVVGKHTPASTCLFNLF